MMEDIPESIKNVFSMYKKILETDVLQYTTRKKRLNLPKIHQDTLALICQEAARAFFNDNIVLELDGEVIIVGDLHGHILDLFRILQNFGPPPAKRYLFLGDLIDRGEFSIETVTLVFVLKVLFPQNIYVIRGNHEFAEMTQYCGFSVEIGRMYRNRSIESSFHQVFNVLPLAALVNKVNLCVHGGIGPQFTNVDQLRQIERPMRDFNFEPALSVLWSDPNQFTIGYKPSPRGTGYLYGARPLSQFLERNRLKLLIRGHECVKEGIKTQLNGCVTTVFSASNYCGLEPNQSGVLVCLPDKNEHVRLPSLRYLRRNQATILLTDCKTSELKPQVKDPVKSNENGDLPLLSQSLKPYDILTLAPSIHVQRPMSSMNILRSKSLPTQTLPRTSKTRGSDRLQLKRGARIQLKVDSRTIHVSTIRIL